MFGNREKETAEREQPLQEQKSGPVTERKTDSVIGQGASMNGTLKIEGSLTVHGEFEGAINCSGRLMIGKTGKVKADLDVGSVSIAGHVEGKVYAKERVELQTASYLKGRCPRQVLRHSGWGASSRATASWERRPRQSEDRAAREEKARDGRAQAGLAAPTHSGDLWRTSPDVEKTQSPVL